MYNLIIRIPITFLLTLGALSAGCFESTSPKESSGSNWLTCRTVDDCGHDAAVSCSSDGYCLDKDGERISVSSVDDTWVDGGDEPADGSNTYIEDPDAADGSGYVIDANSAGDAKDEGSDVIDDAGGEGIGEIPRNCAADTECSGTYGKCEFDWIAIREDGKQDYEESVFNECGPPPEWDQPTAWPLAGCVQDRCEIMGIDPVNLDAAKECTQDSDCVLVSLHCMDDCVVEGVNTNAALGYESWLQQYCQAYEGPTISYECDQVVTVCRNDSCALEY